MVYISATFGDSGLPLAQATRVELDHAPDSRRPGGYRTTVRVGVAAAPFFSSIASVPVAACKCFVDACLRLARERPGAALIAYANASGLPDTCPTHQALLTVWTRLRDRTVLSAPGTLLPRDGGPIRSAIAGIGAAPTPNIADLGEEVFRL